VRNAFPDMAYLVEKEDLLRISPRRQCRITHYFRKRRQKTVGTPQRPFTSKQYKQLPKTHWTLLVQAVDHYLPELAAFWQNLALFPVGAVMT
jgi:50S ribosomal protein L16 3-hydroxylase